MNLIEFVCVILMVALLVKFFRTLAEKWGILEYLQAHAKSDFTYKLYSCEFCQSFWLSLGVCVILAIFVHWSLIFVPIFSCNIR